MKTFELYKENEYFGILDDNKVMAVPAVYKTKEEPIDELLYFLRLNNEERPFLSFSVTEQEIVEIENQLKNQLKNQQII